jgi:predicted MFS family arabinose efflux permease
VAEITADPILTDPPEPARGARAGKFTVRDVFRDRATLGKFTAVLGLHMGQTFPAAFFGLMLTAIYREKGLPLDMFWIFMLPSIPTWLRPLWAPFVDGVGSSRIGLRKTWFIPCTLFGAAAYLSLAFFEPEIATLWIIIAILIVKTTFMTTQDIAIDGYMVENLRDEERGVGAAVMDIGRNVAQFSSWAGVAWVYGTYGWPAAVITAASLLILFSLPGIIRREPPPPPQAQRRRDRGEHPSLIKLFRRPDTRIILPLVMLVSFGGGLISSLYIAYLVDVGFTVKQIGPLILAPATLLGTVVGATLTAWFLNRFGYKTTILVSAFLMIPTVIPIIWMGSIEKPSLLTVFLVTLNAIILPSFLTIAIAASRLKWSSKTQAATDYTSFVVVATAAGAAALGVGGVIAQYVGWHMYFLGSGLFVTACCFVFYMLFDRIEAIVEARDIAELALEPHSSTRTTAGARHGIG